MHPQVVTATTDPSPPRGWRQRRRPAPQQQCSRKNNQRGPAALSRRSVKWRLRQSGCIAPRVFVTGGMCWDADSCGLDASLRTMAVDNQVDKAPAVPESFPADLGIYESLLKRGILDDRRRRRPAACRRSVIRRLRRSGAPTGPDGSHPGRDPAHAGEYHSAACWCRRAAPGRPPTQPAHGAGGDSGDDGIAVDLDPRGRSESTCPKDKHLQGGTDSQRGHAQPGAVAAPSPPVQAGRRRRPGPRSCTQDPARRQWTHGHVERGPRRDSRALTPTGANHRVRQEGTPRVKAWAC